MKRRIAWILAAVMALAALPCLALTEDAGPEGSIAVFPEKITGIPAELSDPGLQKLIEDGTCRLTDYDDITETEISYPDGYIEYAYYDTATGQLIEDYGCTVQKELPDSVWAYASYSGKDGLTGYGMYGGYERDGLKVYMNDSYSPDRFWNYMRRIESEDGGFDLYLFESNKDVVSVMFQNYFDGAELKVKGGEWTHYTADADGKPVKNPDLDPEYTRPLSCEIIPFGILDVSKYPEYPVPETEAVSLGGEGERTGFVLKNDSFVYLDLGNGEAALLTYIGKATGVDIGKLMPGKTVVAVMDYCFSQRKAFQDPDVVPVYTYGGVPYECAAKVSKVTLPDTVTYIAPHAFESVPIQQIALPEGLKEIGEQAFCGTKIAKIPAVPEGCVIGEGAFLGLNAGSVTVPEGITKLPAKCFAGAFAGSFKLPSTLEEIGAEAFAYCPKLKSVVLPNGITEIPEGAFRDCAALTSVTIPAGVEAIAADAFEGCSPKLVLTVTAGSFAEGWAAENGIAVKAKKS